MVLTLTSPAYQKDHAGQQDLFGSATSVHDVLEQAGGPKQAVEAAIIAASFPRSGSLPRTLAGRTGRLIADTAETLRAALCQDIHIAPGAWLACRTESIRQPKIGSSRPTTLAFSSGPASGSAMTTHKSILGSHSAPTPASSSLNCNPKRSKRALERSAWSGPLAPWCRA
jgi:hypothetical protein